MESVTLEHAKEHLDELIERARRGEDVRITDAKLGTVRLQSMPVTTRPAFVPLDADRVPYQLAGKMTVPARLMEPMSEEELKDWYGDDT